MMRGYVWLHMVGTVCPLKLAFFENHLNLKNMHVVDRGERGLVSKKQ